MIQIYYAYADEVPSTNFEFLTSELSLRSRAKLEGLRRYQDKRLQLISAGLLARILMDNGQMEYKLKDLQYSESGRPYFPNAPFDFNISHTENCAAVAYMENGRVGIDVEKIKEIDLEDFNDFFSQDEWDEIHSSPDSFRTFYDFWTRFESTVKADGRGLPLLSMKRNQIFEDHVILDGQTWFPVHKRFDNSISCCITSNRKGSPVEILEIQAI